MISLKDVSDKTRGMLVDMRCLTRERSWRPRAPPGWYRAKFSALNWRRSMRHTIRASPSSMVAVVDVVGARLRGQTSRSMGTLSTISASCASAEFGLPVMAMMRAPMFLRGVQILTISEDVPLCEMSRAMSLDAIMPRSPCMASAALTKIAGVPVEARDAAILCPTMPVLPMPRITTLPVHEYIISTVWSISSSRRFAIRWNSVISCSNICLLRSFQVMVVVFVVGIVCKKMFYDVTLLRHRLLEGCCRVGSDGLLIDAFDDVVDLDRLAKDVFDVG